MEVTCHPRLGGTRPSGGRGSLKSTAFQLLLVKILCYSGIDTLCTVETSLEDSAIRADKHKMRDTLDTIDICRHATCIIDMRPVHTELGCCVDGHLNRLTLPDSDAEDIEVLTCILIIYCLEIRNLSLAWTAPWSPEIHEDIFTLTDIVRELHLCIFRLRRYAAGHSYNRIHCKINERLTLCSIDSCLDSLLHTLYELMLLKSWSKKVQKRIKFRILKFANEILKGVKCDEIVCILGIGILVILIVLGKEAFIELIKSLLLLLFGLIFCISDLLLG